MGKTNKISKKDISKLKKVDIKEVKEEKSEKVVKEDKSEKKLPLRTDSIREIESIAKPGIHIAPTIISDFSNRIDNLENFASTVPSQISEEKEKPYSASTGYNKKDNYGNGKYDQGKYDERDFNEVNTFRQDTPSSLRSSIPFTANVQQNNRQIDNMGANRLEESARLQQRYESERKSNIERGVHQSRDKREIF